MGPKLNWLFFVVVVVVFSSDLLCYVVLCSCLLISNQARKSCLLLQFQYVEEFPQCNRIENVKTLWNGNNSKKVALCVERNTINGEKEEEEEEKVAKWEIDRMNIRTKKKSNFLKAAIKRNYSLVWLL